jgi:hypothetical protein
VSHRSEPHRRAQRPIDLSGSIHGTIQFAIAADDRAVRYRPARDHEFCDPEHQPACVLAFEPPPAVRGRRHELWVAVRRVSEGVRTRSPYWVLNPGKAA